MAIKSLIIQTRVDTALRAHRCQANARHLIARGDVRLKVQNGRSWDHYCQACAQNILRRDIAKLGLLLEQYLDHSNQPLNTEDSSG